MLLQRSLWYSQFAFGEVEIQTLQLRCAKMLFSLIFYYGSQLAMGLYSHSAAERIFKNLNFSLILEKSLSVELSLFEVNIQSMQS